MHDLLRCRQGKPMPRCAHAARFDQAVKQVRVTCAKNTRTEILGTIHAWFNGERLATDTTLRTAGNAQGPVFWLDGVAGTGKSTIAQTVANHYHQTKQLGASFCSRDNAVDKLIALVRVRPGGPKNAALSISGRISLGPLHVFTIVFFSRLMQNPNQASTCTPSTSWRYLFPNLSYISALTISVYQ